MKRTAELLLAVLVSGLLFFQLGSCGRDPVDDTRQDAYETESILRRNRNVLTEAVSAKVPIRREIVRNDPLLLTRLDSLTQALDYAERVLATDSNNVVLLRVALRESVRQARHAERDSRAQALRVRAYLAADAVAEDAMNRTLIAADSSIAAWKRNADAERRKGWRRFTQGAFVGGIAALLLVVAL